MAVTLQLLSGSTNGKHIKVAATATPGTTLHTAITGTTDIDEVWLTATNTHTADVTLTIEWGGTTSPDNTIVVVLHPNETRRVVQGELLQNGLVIRAFATTANKVIISGGVHRYTP